MPLNFTMNHLVVFLKLSIVILIVYHISLDFGKKGSILQVLYYFKKGVDFHVLKPTQVTTPTGPTVSKY